MAHDNLTALKKGVFDYVALRLGDGIIDLELDPAHYEIAFEQAVGTYRQRAQNSTEESYIWLELQESVNEYTLPTEVTHVRQVYRRTMGSSQGPHSTSFDPFSSATLNVYLLNFTYSGGLATYELYSQYVELAQRMFGAFMNYTFNPVTKQIRLVRDPKGSGEVVLLWTYNQRPESMMLQDPQISQWLKDYTYSAAKLIIGEAREKFASISGPQGGTALNGSQLKAEAQAEMMQLVEDLYNFVDGSQPLTWVIG
jgi:hypothetical protein